MSTSIPPSSAAEPDSGQRVGARPAATFERQPILDRTPPPVIWPFIKACITAFAISIAAFGALSGVSGGLGDFKIMQYIGGVAAAQMLAPMMAIPAFVLGRLSILAGVPRGVADVGIGGLLGCIFLISGDNTAQHIGFIIGGLIGGFTFWRAQGYPGSSARSAELADKAARVIR